MQPKVPSRLPEFWISPRLPHKRSLLFPINLIVNMNITNSFSPTPAASIKRIQLPGVIAKFCSLLLLLLGALSTRAGDPTPPGNMSYQGYLTDADGKSLGVPAQNYTVKFRIYNGTTTSAALKWSEQQTVTVDNGHFSVLLGNGSAVAGDAPAFTSLTDVFAGLDASDRYIGMTVTGGPGATEAEILPRLQLLTSPYAFLARTAVSVSGQNTILPSNLSPTIGLWSASGADVYRTNGNVGIGTATPYHNFVVRTGTDQNFQVRPYAYGTNSAVLLQAADDANTTSVPMEFGASTFTFHGGAGSGNVGIGTAFPTAKLDVAGLIKTRSGQVYFSDTDGTDRAVVGLQSSSATDPVVGLWNGDWHFVVKRSGKVGMGTTTPRETAEVRNGFLRIAHADEGHWWNIYSGGPNDGFLYFQNATGKGATLRWIDGALGTISDRRLKKDIEPLGSVLQAALTLRPVSYRFKDTGSDSRKSIGFIAQEVEALFPSAVGEMNGMKNLVYSDLIPVAFGAIQELSKQVQTVKEGQNRIAELEEKASRVVALERKVEELEKLVGRLANLQKNSKPVVELTTPDEAEVSLLADNK